MDPLLDDICIYAEPAGDGVHVDLALDGVRDIRDGVCNLVDEAGLFEGVVAGIGKEEVRFEGNAVLLMCGDEFPDFLQGVFPGVGAMRVDSGGEI